MRDEQSILIVDDEAGSRSLLARSLSAAGYKCRESGSGIEALKLIQGEQPAVLLLDLIMPELDGAETLKQLRADPNPAIAQIPTIMFTGHGESEVQCLEAGADDFVIKPIKLEVLRARIETQLRLRSLRIQLHEQNQKLEDWRRNLERDLAAARLTQRSLIPQKPPVISGWQIATHYRPVIEVGGDIYGWQPLRDKRCLFWIADAAGHGASAALLTTLAKLLFQHGSDEQNGPDEIMRAVNNDFRNTFGGKSFMTAMCAAVNTDTGEISVVGAGHPPLLVTRFGRGTETIASSAPPLGLAEPAQFTQTILSLGRGDAFILYTDGLLGAVGRGGSRPTPIQLAGMINPFATNAEGILDPVLKQAAPLDETTSLADDVAAIAVRREN
jgi:sigma-B regulation protein RsbU (phosphoserine phosphatase)